LPQWARGGLNTWGIAVLWVTRGLAMKLAKILQLFDGQVIARQVQQGIDQHGAMAIGEHKTISVRPLGVAGIVLEIVIPENLGDVRHAHRRSGVARIGLLDRIHAQGTDGIGEFSTVGRHAYLQNEGAG